MGKFRKHLKRSADGRFFLFTVGSTFPDISMEKKTKLWLSSPYLFEESIKQDARKTERDLEEMLRWNEHNQNYEVCEKILQLKKKLNQAS